MISISFAEAARPRLVAPPGWAVSAARLLAPGGGPAIELVPLALEAEETLSSSAARAGDQLARELPGYEEYSLEERRTRAGTVLVRSYGWDEAGRPRRGFQLFGPGGVLATLPESEESRLAEVAEVVGAFAFAAPHGLSGAFSVEELTALAEEQGAGSFPGTGDHAFASERERAAARRALLARGTLQAGSNGKAALGPLDERTVATALRPNAVIQIEVSPPGGAAERCLIYAGGSVSVAHSAGAEGVHRLEAVPTALLQTVLRALTRPGRQPVETSAAVQVVRGGEGNGASLAWVEHADGPHVAGGEGTAPEPASREQVEAMIDALCAPLLPGGGTA